MLNVQALIIDDNPHNIVVLSQLLLIEGVIAHQISPALSIGLQLEKMVSVDIIFLDLEMPHVDGYQVLRLIRENEKLARTKVIAYSVHFAELNSTLDLGFDGFLGKPLDAELFPEQLQRILNGERVVYFP